MLRSEIKLIHVFEIYKFGIFSLIFKLVETNIKFNNKKINITILFSNVLLYI